jgi:two-component system response regulator YesN
MKKTVMVIDDKPIIRRAIVQTTDWDRLGCEVVAQAEDGLEGLALLGGVRPDILITDIKMPGLSGLELAEWMQSNIPESKTILITGHQEFEFAKQAVKWGAFDFIVKPIHDQEFAKAIQAAVNKIDEEQAKKRQSLLLSNEVSRLERRHANSLPDLRSKWVENRIKGLEVGRTAKGDRAEFDIEFSRFVLLAFRPIIDGSSSREIRLDKREELTQLAVDLCHKLEIETVPVYLHQELFVMCLFKHIPDGREVRRKLQAAASNWLKTVEGMTGIRYRAAFGSIYRAPKELLEAGREVSKLLDSGFFRSEESILFVRESEDQAKIQLSIMQDMARFEKSFEGIPLEQLIKDTEQLVGQISLYSAGNITVAKGLLSEICLSIAQHYYHATGDEFGLGKSVNQLLEEVNQLGSLKEASEYLTELVTTTRLKLAGEEKEYSMIVKSILEYIHNHYAEPITLTSVSSRFGISSGYLSRLLRAETGENFVDIISKSRIKAAKQLLGDPRYKVNEVGELVGYKEYAYFYQVFKRQEGCSPKEYKKKR